jgi:hypothetical protein
MKTLLLPLGPLTVVAVDAPAIGIELESAIR